MSCNHRYCNDCWTSWVVAEMEKGPTVVYSVCPEHKYNIFSFYSFTLDVVKYCMMKYIINSYLLKNMLCISNLVLCHLLLAPLL